MGGAVAACGIADEFRFAKSSFACSARYDIKIRAVILPHDATFARIFQRPREISQASPFLRAIPPPAFVPNKKQLTAF